MPRAVLYFTGEALENDDDVSIVWEREKKTLNWKDGIKNLSG